MITPLQVRQLVVDNRPSAGVVQLRPQSRGKDQPDAATANEHGRYRLVDHPGRRWTPETELAARRGDDPFNRGTRGPPRADDRI